MTITGTSARSTPVNGTGSEKDFNVPFRFLAKADLTVVLREGTTDTVQALYTHYDVSGVGAASGGTVTFVTAPTLDPLQKVIIINDPALTQGTDYITGGTFPAETHEAALDLLTIQQQRTRDMADRTPRLGDGDDDGGATPGSYDANTNKIINLGTPTLTADATTKTYVDALVNNTALGPAPTGLVATGSVTSRLLADRWGEIKNVKDFGAVGNGSANDTAAIQAAINAAAGAVVWFPLGTYKITDTISNTSATDIHLLADGKAVITAIGNVTHADGAIFRLGGNGVTTHLSVKGIRFNGNHGSYGSNDRILQLEANHVLVEDCTFEGYGVQGVRSTQYGQVSETYFTTVLNCHADGGSNGIYCNGGGSKHVEGCTVKNTTAGPIYLQGDATDAGGTDNGIGYGQGKIIGNLTVDCFSGGQIRHCANGVISGNICRNPTGRGFTLGNSQGSTAITGNTLVIDDDGLTLSAAGITIDVVEESPADSSINGNIVVSGNTIQNISGTSTIGFGIRCTGVKNLLMTGNLIGGTNDACIQSPDEYCDSYLITGNYFLNWTGDGIRLTEGDHHVLSGNTFYPASTGQDYFRGTFESVVGNTFYSTGYINGAKNFGGNVFPDLSGAGTNVVPSGSANADMKKPRVWDTLTSSTTLWGSIYDHRIVDTTAGNRNITLPDTASVGFGQTLRFLKTVTANNFSILSQGSDVINHDGTSATTINNIINSSNTGHLELISLSNNGTPTWFVINRTLSTGPIGENPLFKVTTLADEATPSVANGLYFVTGGTANDPITDFDDGVVGQTITVKAKHAVQITDGGDLELAGNFVMASGDTITLTMFEAGTWSEISRSDTT